MIARCAERLERAAPALSDGDSRVSPWSTAALYERWCALEICRALGLSDEHGARLMAGAAVRAPWPGGALILDAQRTATSPMPLALRPDFTLRVGDRAVHLDAKYRLDPSTRDGGFVRDELIKMHAYRDAIPGSVGAYALFPGAAEDRIEGRDARGGVGALPLRAERDEALRRAQREALRGVLTELLG
ncbi:MAG: nuclease domain-containing protein [Polyangiales bacterium]